MTEVIIERVDLNLKFPRYQTPGSSGLDLHCADQKMTVFPGGRVFVSCGIKVHMPEGIEGQVRSRSGLARDHGIVVLNSPGTVDSDYRGVISVILHNSSQIAYTLNYGDRVAQLVFARVEKPLIVAGTVDSDTERGDAGYGSTGV